MRKFKNILKGNSKNTESTQTQEASSRDCNQPKPTENARGSLETGFCTPTPKTSATKPVTVDSLLDIEPTDSQDQAFSSKVAQLQEMFPNLKENVIRSTLSQYNGSVESSVETLLNLQNIKEYQETNALKSSRSLSYDFSVPLNTSANTVKNIEQNRSQLPPEQQIQPSLYPQIRPTERSREHPLTKLASDPNLSKNMVETKRTIPPSNNYQPIPVGKPNSSSSTATEPNNDSLGPQISQACEYGDVGKLESLFKDKTLSKRSDLKSVFSGGLLVAIERGYYRVVRCLLNNGVSVNGSSDGEMIPLILSMETGQVECAKILLCEFDANPNLSKTDYSPLHIAIKNKYSELVDLLIKKGASIDQIHRESGKTPLHFAVDMKNYEFTSKLIENGCNQTIRDINGDTPLLLLMRSCKDYFDMQILCLLLESSQENRNDRSIDIPNAKTGDTVLHLTVQQCSPGNNYFLQVVLRYKPNPNIKNFSGQTALDFANASRKTEVIELITNYMKNDTKKLIEFPEDEEQEEEADDELPLVNRNLEQPRSLSKAPPPVDTTKKPTPSNEISSCVPSKVTSGPSSFSKSNANANSATTANMKDNAIGVKSNKASISKSRTNSFKGDPDWLLVYNFRLKIENMITNDLIMEEYRDIEQKTGNVNLTENFTSALLSCNVKKNRYKNILPLEKTRVKLSEIEGIPGSDYISASYVSGEVPGSSKCYIAACGPLENTVVDFWRMIWEQGSIVIVMLANLIEMGREKVYCYWPKEDSSPLKTEFHSIELSETQQLDLLFIRTLKLTEIKSGDHRTITHLQYTGWPDQGLPQTTAGFRQVIDLADQYNTNGKPMIVHCSAGIGRTGVFCAIHCTIAKLKCLLSSSLQSEFDIKKTVLRMRSERVGMVQTEEQYNFCYHALRDTLDEFEQILQYKGERWFHKRADAISTNELLKNQPNGTFLFRPSSVPGFLVLTALKDHRVLNARIAITEKGFLLEKTVYPSLTALVESKKKVLVHPLYHR